METTQPLPKDWRFASNHLKDLIIGDVSKGVTTRSKLHDLFGHFAFISYIEPKNIIEAEANRIGCLQCKKSSINFSATKFDILFLDPMIDQPLVQNGSLGTNWMSRIILLRIKLGQWSKVTPKLKVSILRKPLQPQHGLKPYG